MDKNRKIEWIKTHLNPGKIVYLVDRFLDRDLPSMYSTEYIKCRLISLEIGNPIWLRLKLVDPKEYPDTLGILVDRIESVRRGKHLVCSFRDSDSMISRLVMTEPTDHLKGDHMGLAEVVSENIWTNLYLRDQHNFEEEFSFAWQMKLRLCDPIKMDGNPPIKFEIKMVSQWDLELDISSRLRWQPDPEVDWVVKQWGSKIPLWRYVLVGEDLDVIQERDGVSRQEAANTYIQECATDR